jgi:hypothetical protein
MRTPHDKTLLMHVCTLLITYNYQQQMSVQVHKKTEPKYIENPVRYSV